MKSIQFLTRYNMYHIGDIAGFPEDVAHKLINLGVAKSYTIPAPPPPVRRGIVDKMIRKGSK